MRNRSAWTTLVAGGTAVCLATLSCTAVPSVTTPPPAPRPIASSSGPPRIDPIALAPRVETDPSGTPRSVVVKLPEDRARLLRVDVWLTVTERVGGNVGKTVHQDHIVFSRNTSGNTLTFPLPPLPLGSYEANVRAVAHVLSLDIGGALFVGEPRESRAVVAAVQRSVELRFYFDLNKYELIPADAEQGVARIRDMVANSGPVGAVADCYASSEGNSEYNLWLSNERCKWFKSNVWVLAGGQEHQFKPVPHGTDQAAVGDGAPARVVVLRVTLEDRQP